MFKFGIVLFLSFVFSVVVVSANVIPKTAIQMTDKENRTQEYRARVDKVYLAITERLAPLNNTIKGVFNRFFSSNPDSAIMKFVENFEFLDNMVTCIGNIVGKLLVVVNNVVKMAIRTVSQVIALLLEERYCYQTYPIKEVGNIGSCGVDMVTIALSEIQSSFSRLTKDTTKIITSIGNWSHVFRHCGNKNRSNGAELLVPTTAPAA